MEQEQIAEPSEGANGAAEPPTLADVAAESAAPLKTAEDVRAQCAEKRQYTALLSVRLDVAELAEIGQRMAGELVKVEDIENEKKELSSAIKELKDNVRSMRSELASGKGERRFDVAEFHDEERCHVYLVRTDTDEIVQDRTMTAFERQGALAYETMAAEQGAGDADSLDDEDEQPEDSDVETDDEDIEFDDVRDTD